ncbi:MAG TPA: hypothetical protein VEB66_14655 [Opitutaceae bacterium]|nr:hypothetical protein [Opitutaceae bacterium]
MRLTPAPTEAPGPARTRIRAWWIAPLVALVAVAALTAPRVWRLQHLSGQPLWSVDAPAADPTAPSGYAGGLRLGLGPDRHADSAVFVAAAERGLSSGEASAAGPHAPRPRVYASMLAGLAGIIESATGRPAGHAAILASQWLDPLILALLAALVGAAWARGAGTAIGLVAGAGLAIAFPFAAGFVPGEPEPRAGATGCAIAALGLLLAAAAARGRAPVWHAAAGVLTGLALWLQAASAVPLFIGLTIAALGVAWLRVAEPAAARSWRAWGIAAAGTTALACWADGRGFGLADAAGRVHPAHVLAWLGLGELLAWSCGRQAPGGERRGRRWVGPVVASLAMAPAVAVAVLAEGPGAWAMDPSAERLGKLPGSPTASSLAVALAMPGARLPVLAALAPVLGAAALLVVRGRAQPVATLLAAGTLVATLPFACAQLHWLGLLSGVAVLGLALGSSTAGAPPGLRAAGTLLLLLPGLVLAFPHSPRDPTLRPEEIEGLIARDLGHWLRSRGASAESIVFAPPRTAAALAHFGGLRPAATFRPEDAADLAGALRIATATGRTETLALLQARRITHVVLPSWDDFLAGYARSAGAGNFHAALERGEFPAWLRPLAYPMPAIAGFEGAKVTVLAVVDEQPEADAAARNAEYFAESGQRERALAAAESLVRYRGDVGALAARVRVHAEFRDGAGVSRAAEALAPLVARGQDRHLAPDRRASLAIALLLARRPEPARAQWELCARELDPETLRALSPATLAAFLLMGQRLGLDFPDPANAALARSLLPPGLRSP